MESTPTVEQNAEADSTLVEESAIMMENEVKKEGSMTEIADQIDNKDLANVDEEQTQDKTVESTPAAEQVLVANLTPIDEQADMITEIEAEKEDSNTKTAAVLEIVENRANIEGEQTQDKPVESTPQSPVQ
ncbi:hypothetical protein Droror1_Dr00025385, partial [Drosera rotundifolia]